LAPPRRQQVDLLGLKAATRTELKVLFDEPWLVEVKQHRLTGARAHDREHNALTCLGGELPRALLEWGEGGLAGGWPAAGRGSHCSLQEAWLCCAACGLRAACLASPAC
jgi:hypothetical protein